MTGGSPPQLKLSHANWLEALSFTIVGEVPDEDKKFPHVSSAIMNARTMRSVYGDGSFGGAYRAAEVVMQEIFTARVQGVLQLLKFE